MSSELFPIASDMATLAEYVKVWFIYGFALTCVFWTLGTLVWFIIQQFR